MDEKHLSFLLILKRSVIHSPSLLALAIESGTITLCDPCGLLLHTRWDVLLKAAISSICLLAHANLENILPYVSNVSTGTLRASWIDNVGVINAVNNMAWSQSLGQVG